MRRALALAVLLPAPARAQAERIVAYPQDTVTYQTDGAVQRGMPVPLGGFSLHGGTSLEGRWQQLIPAPYLPTTPGTITALSAVCADVVYAPFHRRLRITLSATTATGLTTTFANNLPAPLTVLDQASFGLPAQAGTWTRIPFAVPFPHDGTSNLVVEFRKESAFGTWCSHAIPVNPERTDLPRAVGVSGWVGSGAADAPTAAWSSVPLQLRLHFATAATLVLRSDRLATGSRHVFALGGTFDLEVHAPAGSVHAAFLDGAFSGPYLLQGIRGRALLLPAFTLPPRLVPAGQIDTQTFAIPPDPRFVGVPLALQALVFDGATNVPLFTNGADLRVSSN